MRSTILTKEDLVSETQETTTHEQETKVETPDGSPDVTQTDTTKVETTESDNDSDGA